MPEPLKVVTLDAVKQRQWIETRTALLWTAPAFTHILFSMLCPKGGELAAVFSTDIPIAATDGSNLILNPDRFFTFPLSERVFIVAHEILHCILNHCSIGRSLRMAGKVRYPDGYEVPYDAEQMNIAMDLVINDLLINDKIGTFPKCGVHDPSKVTDKDGFLDAYRKTYKKKPQGGQGNGPGNGPSGPGAGQEQGNSPQPGTTPGSGFDVTLDPGTAQGQDATQATQERSQTEWDTAVAAALSAAKLQGKLPAGVARLLSEIVEPTVSWQEHIRAFFARNVGVGGYDFHKPDRRLIQRDIFAPARAGYGCEAVVVAVDTSGSIGQRELDHFFAEMVGILDEVRPRTLYVIWCDAKVHKVDEVEDSGEIATLKPAGGGGTRFEPVFEKVEEMGLTPDALVYLTDGYGSFPEKAPRYPVIWGDIHHAVKFPWGDVVAIDLKHKK